MKKVKIVSAYRKKPNQPIVRLSEQAMDQLFNLAQETGKPIGTLASDIIIQVIQNDLIEIEIVEED